MKEIEGKSLTLTICLNKNNLAGENTVYFASDVSEGNETSESCSTLEKSEFSLHNVSYATVCEKIQLLSFGMNSRQLHKSKMTILITQMFLLYLTGNK